MSMTITVAFARKLSTGCRLWIYTIKKKILYKHINLNLAITKKDFVSYCVYIDLIDSSV